MYNLISADINQALYMKILVTEMLISYPRKYQALHMKILVTEMLISYPRKAQREKKVNNLLAHMKSNFFHNFLDYDHMLKIDQTMIQRYRFYNLINNN